MGNEETDVSEQQIIAMVLDGRKDEFRHLVRLHQNQVFAMINRQVRDETIAKDLAQDTFIRAYRYLPSFRSESSFSTWLIRIALNTTNSYFKSRAHRERQQTVELDTHKPAKDNQDSVEYRDKLLRFQAALSKLKPAFRETLVLCGLEGKSYEEVAAIMRVPVGTVRSRLNSARLQIKSLIEN